MITLGAAQEVKFVTQTDIDVISNKLKKTRDDINQCYIDFNKCSTEGDLDLDLLHSIAEELGSLREREIYLNMACKISRNRYNEAWPKVVKIEKEIEKLQKQFWIKKGLSILPDWEQKTHAD